MNYRTPKAKNGWQFSDLMPPPIRARSGPHERFSFISDFRENEGKRVFALHKLWLSKQPGRDPLKKPKDREQAFLVAELLTRYLPQPRFSKRDLWMLPREVAQLADELTDRPKSQLKNKTSIRLRTPR
jgi:hypothetical protein